MSNNVGDILHDTLATFGIKEDANCDCDSHRRTMNAWGPKLVRDNINDVINWMSIEARKRSMPFSRLAAKALIIWCCRQAEKHIPKDN